MCLIRYFEGSESLFACLFVLKQDKKKIIFNLFGLSSLLVFSQSLTNKITNWEQES